MTMPIKPENKARYPKNWNTEIRPRILDRAGNRCEMCGVENHTYRLNPKTGKMAFIVLTIAHILNEDPSDCRDENLMALCQRCHNGLDAKMRAKHRMATQKKKDKSLNINFDE